jgi:hypothetical protein
MLTSALPLPQGLVHKSFSREHRPARAKRTLTVDWLMRSSNVSRRHYLDLRSRELRTLGEQFP